MANQIKSDKRRNAPYLDRRTGEDRRYIHRISYFTSGGIENRDSKERREDKERRKKCVRVTKWSSVCLQT